MLRLYVVVGVHVHFLISEKISIYMSLYELCPRSVPNINHMSHREQIRPFAKMIAKPKYQTKKNYGKRMIKHDQPVSQDFSNNTHQIRLGVGEWQIRYCRTKIALHRLMIKSVKKNLK